MAKLTDITEKNAAPGADYLVHVVDPTDITDSPDGSSFRMTVANLVGGFIAALGVYFNTSTDTADDITDGSTKVLMTASERTKLTGVASGATANQTDAHLKARANHTGTQLAETISDFATAADVRAAAAVATHEATGDPHTQYHTDVRGDARYYGKATVDAMVAAKADASHTHDIAAVTGLQAALDAKLASSQKGAAGGIAELDGTGKVPAAQLPSFVDDIIEGANLASFPGTGETGKIYVALDNGKTYRWSGSAYVEISASPGSTDAVTEGVTNLYFTAARVLATVLTGLSTATNAAISATDTVLGALGKLQAQINAVVTALDGKASTSHTHDDRYYTETEADALLAAKAADSAVVKLTGTQMVAGAKTFSDTVVVPRIDYTSVKAGVASLGDLGASRTIDTATANVFEGTINTNLTSLSFSNLVAGRRFELRLRGNGTKYAITWPTVVWSDNGNGTPAPDEPTTTGQYLRVIIEVGADGTTLFATGAGCGYAAYS